jgi:hypothetical protein
MIPTLEHHPGDSLAETFSGVACCTTLSNAIFCPAAIPAVPQRSKAAPLQALGLFTHLGKHIGSLPPSPPHELIL